MNGSLDGLQVLLGNRADDDDDDDDEFLQILVFPDNMFKQIFISVSFKFSLQHELVPEADSWELVSGPV